MFSKGRSSRSSWETSERSSWSSNITAVRSKGRSSVCRSLVGGASTGAGSSGVVAGASGVVDAERLGGGLGLGGHLFEERILEQLLLHDLLQLEGRELQELDRLLEQRGHDDPLALPE